MQHELSGARRLLRPGMGSVTPTSAVTITIDGERQTLRPGRDRLAVEHPIVMANPAAFRATRADDARTRSALTRMQANGHKTAALRATRAPSRTPRGHALKTGIPHAAPGWRLTARRPGWGL